MSASPSQPGSGLCHAPVVDRGADVSPCGLYRYSLFRRWAYERPPVLFVMLNPSTADAAQDDPTIRKCIGFAQRWGAGGIEVCNLYPWRATDPANLPPGPEVFGDPTRGGHERNAIAIRQAALGAGRVVAAWGSKPGPWKSQRAVVLSLLTEHCDEDVEALKLTRDGEPWHPLYVPYSAEPVVFAARSAA